MRIIAFSDWRVQSLPILKEIIKKECPELILYAGDDLHRFLGFDKIFYIKSYNNFIEVDRTNLNDFFQNKKVAKNPIIKQFIDEFIKKKNSNYLTQFNIPFIYVNGNDDTLIKKNDEYYIKILRRIRINEQIYRIYENLDGNIDVISFQKDRDVLNNSKYLKKVKKDLKKDKHISNTQEIKNLLKNKLFYKKKNSYLINILKRRKDPLNQYTKDNGIYIKIKLNFGITSFKVNSETLTIFGCECTSNINSQLMNTPYEYADIYLSHLPPLGKLDLSTRFGINHLGSKELLEAINKYKPKYVICGHSHIWGGFMERINNSIVLNVSSEDNSSSINEGNYAIINTEDWSFQLKSTRDFDQKNLSLRKIRGFRTIEKQLLEKERIYLPKHLENINSTKNEKEIKEILRIFKYFNLKKQLHYADFSVRNVLEDLNPIVKNFISQELRIDLEKINLEINEAERFYKEIKSDMTIEEGYDVLNRMEQFGIKTFRVKNRLKSLQKGKVEILRGISLNPEKYYFVDVETGLEPERLWLIGIANGKTEELKQFIYPQESEQFFKYLKDNNITILVSWSNYDQKALNPILQSKKIKLTFYDACARTSYCLTWHTYKLHELYDKLFLEKKTSSTIISGKIAGLYADHLIFDNRVCPHCSDKKESVLDEIKKRNKLDILQMIEICKFLYKKEEFVCQYCNREFSRQEHLKRHLKNNVCKKLKKNMNLSGMKK